MTFTGAGGVTLVKLLRWPNWALWVGGLGLAAAGYSINLFFVNRARKKKQRLLMMQDYERSVMRMGTERHGSSPIAVCRLSWSLVTGNSRRSHA